MDMQEKVLSLLERLGDVERQLGAPDVADDLENYRALTREHARLSELKEIWGELSALRRRLVSSQALLEEETDPEILEMAQEEIAEIQSLLPKAEKAVELLLVPPDPRDDCNVILELRAGTGGDEAAIFVGDCVRMYRLYADHMQWQTELLSASPSSSGGYKEYIMSVSGKGVFRFLQYEAGTHRVQRVPVTETQGRVHTSAITVALLIEPMEEEKVQIEEKDLKIDTYRASGAGGQHVNVTDSAVRITHTPSGIVVACQEERSQHKNKEKAMRVLRAKLAEKQQMQQHQEMAALRAKQIGSGDRSERIRTYNFPQNRITDHRIDLSLYKLDQVMEGDLEEISQSLVAHYYHKKLAS